MLLAMLSIAESRSGVSFLPPRHPKGITNPDIDRRSAIGLGVATVLSPFFPAWAEEEEAAAKEPGLATKEPGLAAKEPGLAAKEPGLAMKARSQVWGKDFKARGKEGLDFGFLGFKEDKNPKFNSGLGFSPGPISSKELKAKEKSLKELSS